MQKLSYEDTFPVFPLFSIGDENVELEIKVQTDNGCAPLYIDEDEEIEYFKQHSIEEALARKNPKLLPKKLYIHDYESNPPQMALRVKFEGEDTEVVKDDWSFADGDVDAVLIVDVIAWQKGSRLIALGRYRFYVYRNGQVIKVFHFKHNPYNPPEKWLENGATAEYRVSAPPEPGTAISDDDPDWGDDD